MEMINVQLETVVTLVERAVSEEGTAACVCPGDFYFIDVGKKHFSNLSIISLLI